ncbi:hypothetical protein WISP_103890 [Willisornis vidua]|uniref:Uncharacterized protein n=1 Tax=Willisornis vidua TaxID=1566151 RepID=A0ABQ9D2K7_9PASS|nr:hypothetical protein WISP_103890 [Willisornis vidua]
MNYSGPQDKYYKIYRGLHLGFEIPVYIENECKKPIGSQLNHSLKFVGKASGYGERINQNGTYLAMLCTPIDREKQSVSGKAFDLQVPGSSLSSTAS